jgi:hypothetical protein
LPPIEKPTGSSKPPVAATARPAMPEIVAYCIVSA